MKVILSLFFVLFTSPLASANFAWNLNDVSYLFALPASIETSSNELLNPLSNGAKGALLPWDDFQRIPTLLNNGNGNKTLYNTSLRVVSVRVDPCPDTTNCQPELRLVWQPVEKVENHWEGKDGTLHTFYAISKEDFQVLKAQLWRLKLELLGQGVSTEFLPLSIHPGFLSSKTRAWFSTELKNIILSNCGQSNLKKITFMSLLVPSTWWRFGSFEKSDSGEWTSGKIPRLTNNIEDIFNSAMEDGSSDVPGKEMDAVFNTLPDTYPEEDDLHALVNRGFRNNDESDRPIFQNKLDAIARFRNPHKTNPRTLDCATCHFADAAAYYATLRFKELENYFSPDAYQNPNPESFNLSNSSLSTKATRIVRAFGYFGASPAFLQRVINDSAESAQQMNLH